MIDAYIYTFYRLLYFPKLGNKHQLLVVGVQSEENLDQLTRLETQEVYIAQIHSELKSLFFYDHNSNFSFFSQVLQSNSILKKAIGIW